MKIRERKLGGRKRRLRLLNHFFLATAVLFVVYLNLIRPAFEPKLEPAAPVLVQAVQHQPRTPPPGVDPDQLSQDEIDLSVRPEARMVSPRFEAMPVPSSAQREHGVRERE